MHRDRVNDNQGAESSLAFHLSLAEMKYAEHPLTTSRMSTIRVRRHATRLLPVSSRVIIRPFIPGGKSRIAAIIGRALALTDEEVEQKLLAVRSEFDSRHFDIEASLRDTTGKSNATF